MLFREDLEEGVAKGPLCALALAGYGDGPVRARRGLVLDKLFEVVVVYVICKRATVSRGRSRNVASGTYNGPILVWTSASGYRRTSYQQVA